jgi:hypothetical protein
MSSVVDICNQGLAAVRAKSINDIDGSSVEAQQCNLHYPLARRQLLADADWGFNTTIAGLAELSGVTLFNYAYVWSYPSDCLHINYLIRNIEEVSAQASTFRVIPGDIHDNLRHTNPSVNPPVEYDVFNHATHGKIIGTIESELRAHYRTDITDTSLFSIDFELALGYMLGSMIAIPILGTERGSEMRDACLALYTGFVNKAKAKASNEQHRGQQESEYITVRRPHG